MDKLLTDYFSRIGRKGGRAKTDRKAEAVRRNLELGRAVRAKRLSKNGAKRPKEKLLKVSETA